MRISIITVSRPLGAMRRWWRARVPSIVREVVGEWRADRVGGLGAEIAFFAVLSVFPALLAIVSALGFLDGLVGSRLAGQVRDAVVAFLEDMLTSQAGATVAAVREVFERENPALVSFATLGTLWAVSRGIFGVARALNIAYDLPEQRSWIRMRLKALILGAGSIVLFVVILVVVVTGPMFGAGRVLVQAADVPEAFTRVWLWLRYPLSFALLLGWAMLIFHFAPNQRTPFRYEVVGAVVTGVLWLASSIGFRLYLEVGVQVNQVLGALGGALILMLWLYLLSLSLLVGAEVNDVLGRRRGDIRVPKEQ